MGIAPTPLGDVIILAGLYLTTISRCQAQEAGAQDLAKQIANPIASLISLPVQLNFDDGFGPNEGERFLLNIQPVIPSDLNEEWNLRHGRC